MNLNFIWQNYKQSIIFTAICLMIAFLWKGINGIYIALILGILEISLSFDNAVVNATVLKKMSEYWQKIFLTIGILIAVFGMRLLFPIIIVALSSHLNPIDVINMAIYNQSQYATYLTSAHPMIAAFGGTFLLMVALKYFVNKEKDTHWIEPLEKHLIKLGKLESVEIVITLSILTLASIFFTPSHEQFTTLLSGVIGLIIYVLVDSIGEYMQEKEKQLVNSVISGGIILFMYLELLDASFSFDGVLGAFAITQDIILIMLGLGIGAMFVRSLTIHLVRKGTLDEYIYLEHGAMWAILSLALLMFASITYSIPDWFTGSLGATLIGLAFYSSYKNKNDAI
jgi:hypothetical protein